MIQHTKSLVLMVSAAIMCILMVLAGARMIDEMLKKAPGRGCLSETVAGLPCK